MKSLLNIKRISKRALRSIGYNARHSLCIKSCDSTNNIARDLCSRADDFTVIIAETQTGGRGRSGKSFFSAKGGIYLSVIVSENCDVQYTVCAAGAVCKAINECGIDAKIKWVNDIFVNDKKVCGILCEKVATEHGNKIIIGIGINHSVKSFPKELADIAASLPTGEVTKHALTLSVLEHLKNALSNAEQYLKYYSEKMLLTGKRVVADFNNSQISGTALGVDKAGELIIKKENGERITLSSGIVFPCE